MLTQHATLSISQAGTTSVLAILPVHCPWALPLYGPLPLFSPCQGLAVFPTLVDSHGFTHQSHRIPKNTHTHADLSTPAPVPLTRLDAGSSQFSQGNRLTIYPSARACRGVSPWGKGILDPGLESRGPRGGPALPLGAVLWAAVLLHFGPQQRPSPPPGFPADPQG